MESNPVAAYLAFFEIEETEDARRHRASRRRNTKPGTGMFAGKRPPGHDLIRVRDNTINRKIELVDVAAKTLGVGHKTVTSGRAAKGAIGLIDHIRQGEVFDQLEAAVRNYLLQIGFHYLFGVHGHIAADNHR